MNHLRTRRLAALTLTAAITAVSLAACGSSSTSSASSSSSGSLSSAGAAATGGQANRAKLAACLKQHGVTLPSRPAGANRRPPAGAGGYGGGGPGVFGGGGAGGGGRFNNPKFRAAFQACGAGQGAPGRGGAFNHAAVTKFVTCVRQHGYNLPAPNFTGKGSVFPANIAANKKFQAASRACAADLRPRPGAGAGGAPPSA
jgi:hypothetical protein